MVGNALFILDTIPLLFSVYLFKSKRNIKDIVTVSVLCIIIRSMQLTSSGTLKTILLFIILFTSFYFSEKEPLLSGIYSSLIFVNDNFALFLSNSIYTVNNNNIFLSFIILRIILLVISIILVLLEKKILNYVREKIPLLKIPVLMVCLILFFELLKNEYLVEMTIPNSEIIVTKLLSNILLALFVFLTVIVLIAQRSESMRLEAESKKAIFENQLAYLKTIEKNAEEVRKFKHDYQNILLSMDTYFQENKFEELKNYYYTQIKHSSESLNSTNTQLSKLTKIQNLALRSIFYVKLSIIDSGKVNLTLEMDKNFYVEEKNEIPLVRALGIILDNAIDALSELDRGELQIAVFENDGSNVVIVKNSCSEDLPPLYQLEEKGYSTKGQNRGIGLSNLQEIMEEADFLLETEIVDHYFIQKIVF
ncbi:sensor histidine kinase [Candidatus Enterococcus ferrettii]|uniref:Two-component system, LytTR family, sensor histidine kinase AgrC n=1 Tax=Candidatus Enterococcus ferrettii TaxID=2815324 RepID=A0ABV0EIL9_9ENTE|nr:GHKL domain-containing protein [Enterococcus sp. 665A]MBO1340436.1 GHKL domain-containing protein [Enterococcus sp. 665A]